MSCQHLHPPGCQRLLWRYLPVSLSSHPLTLSPIPFHFTSFPLTHVFLPASSSPGLQRHHLLLLCASSAWFHFSSPSISSFSITVDSLKFKEQQLPIHLFSDWGINGEEGGQVGIGSRTYYRHCSTQCDVFSRWQLVDREVGLLIYWNLKGEAAPQVARWSRRSKTQIFWDWGCWLPQYSFLIIS